MAKNQKCPSCGAPLEIKNRFVKLIACDFCGNALMLHDKGLDPTGQTSKLAELPSILYIDATGRLAGKPFQVVGRLRYQSEVSYWDEWFLTFNNGSQPGWLIEDEGTFKFLNKKTLTGSVPPFHTISVGATVKIAGKSVFISEKGEAKIAGGEGQLAFRILPGEVIRYVDGSCGQELISVEFTDHEVELSVGRPIDNSILIVDEDDFY